MSAPRTDGPPRVLHIVTSSMSVVLMQGQLQYLKEAGFDVSLASSWGRELEHEAEDSGTRVFGVEMARGISPGSDVVSFWRLWRLIRRLRPDLTNVSTPKAGLLGGLAAWLNRVPCRVYTLRGLRWESAHGIQRRLLMFADLIACRCAHLVLCVSESARKKAVATGFVNPDKILVLGAGSSNGVIASRFTATEERLKLAAKIRQVYSIPSDAPVIGFVGRLTRDKGVPELLEAHRQLHRAFPSLRLLLVGTTEREDALPCEVNEMLEADPSIVLAGQVDDPGCFYHVMDILVLPTHREGFPNVVLEAHAAGRPVVTYDATGAVDAVVDSVNGFIVPVGEVSALVQSITTLLNNPALAAVMGRRGFERIQLEFQPARIWSALVQIYVRLLVENGIPCGGIPRHLSKPYMAVNLERASR